MKETIERCNGNSRINRVEASPIRTFLDRAAELKSQGHPVIPLSAGEPNFNTPKTIKDATIEAIEENYSHYGSNRGDFGLRSILSRFIKKETGTQYDPADEIFITSSGAEALNNAIMAFVEDRDEVIVFTPAFVTYKNLVKYQGATFVDIPLKPENGFQPDPKEVEAAITEKTTMMIMNNPNNPTGAVFQPDILKELAKISVRHNLLVLSDEMYSRLVYGDTPFVSMASFPDMKERCIIVNGFSKTYAMTGWRIGYIATSRQMGIPLLRMHQYSTTCTPTFIQKGLVKALELPETQAEVEGMIKTFAKRRQIILEGLSKINHLSFIQPEGAFYVMVDVSKTGLSGLEFAKRLLEEKYVACVPAIGLGDSCGDFVRFSYAACEQDILEGLKRIEEFVCMLS